MNDFKALLLKVLSYETDIDWLVSHEDFTEHEQQLLQDLYAEASSTE